MRPHDYCRENMLRNDDVYAVPSSWAESVGSGSRAPPN